MTDNLTCTAFYYQIHDLDLLLDADELLEDDDIFPKGTEASNRDVTLFLLFLTQYKLYPFSHKHSLYILTQHESITIYNHLYSHS